MDERERWVGGRRRQRKVDRKEGSGWVREREVGSEELRDGGQKGRREEGKEGRNGP